MSRKLLGDGKVFEKVAELAKEEFRGAEIVRILRDDNLFKGKSQHAVETTVYNYLKRIKKANNGTNFSSSESVINAQVSEWINSYTFSIDSLPVPQFSDISELSKFYEWLNEGRPYLEEMLKKLFEKTCIEKMNNLEQQLKEMTEKWQASADENSRLRIKVDALGRQNRPLQTAMAVLPKPV